MREVVPELGRSVEMTAEQEPRELDGHDAVARQSGK
jgi:hypothetical protein